MIDQTAQIQRLLSEAIGAARAGDNKYARPLLRRVVGMDPQNEQAWLWLSQVEETPVERLRALERVLAINPENSAAQRGLALLRRQAEQQSAEPLEPGVQPAGSAPTDPARSAQQQARHQLSPMEELRPMIEASRRRKSPVRPSEIVIFLLGLILLWLVGRIIIDIVYPEIPERPLAPEEQTGFNGRPAMALELPLLDRTSAAAPHLMPANSWGSTSSTQQPKLQITWTPARARSPGQAHQPAEPAAHTAQAPPLQPRPSCS